MKIVQINTTCGSGSTGRICSHISEILTDCGVENYILYSMGSSNLPNAAKYTNCFEVKLATVVSRLFGNWGFEGVAATRRLIRKLEMIEPDIVHLHNIHTHACNLEILFSWLKEKQIKTVWTFHDCWAFTGYCMHYDGIGCQKWREHCGNCPQRKKYSFLIDGSRNNLKKKKDLLRGADITLVTPSEWLAQQVKMSFLSGENVRVIHNGIDLSLFRQIDSDFKKYHRCENKHIVLGVSSVWNQKKGLDVFLKLADRLDPGKYQIVLVGTDAGIEKNLPTHILPVSKTENVQELAAIYSAADVFVNPTREETYPTVNMEALACGTPVVTFRTGGSPEIVDEHCGIVVEKDDMAALEKAIIHVCEERIISSLDCEKRARGFQMNQCFEEYLELYHEIGVCQ